MAKSKKKRVYPPTAAAMSWWMLLILVATMAGIIVSGVGLWWCQQFPNPSEVFGSAWEVWWLELHSCCVPATLIAFGMILRSHVFKGFQLGRNRFSGSLLLLTIAWLTISGWGLYHTGDDWWRHFYHQTH